MRREWAEREAETLKRERGHKLKYRLFENVQKHLLKGSLDNNN